MFGSVEFYVICAVAAAAIVAYAALPSRRGAVRTFFATGTLHEATSAEAESIAAALGTEPAIRASVDSHGVLVIERGGLDGIFTDGACNLALKISGLDVTIEERLSVGRRGWPATAATMRIDCLGAERFHFLYNSETTGRKAAFTLRIAPGNTVVRELNL